MTIDNAIKFEQLQFYRQPSTPVLNIDYWSIKKGQSIFLYGPSGSGKSTLLHLIAGTLLPNSGSINVLNQELKLLSGSERDRFRADHIGVIFQQFNLIPYLSVVENIQLGAQFTRKVATPDTLNTLCQQLQLDRQLLPRKASQLSMGQQQRVAVARALYNQPDIIMADEPTSALDSNNRDHFINLLLQQQEQTRATVLFVSHDQSLAHHFDQSIALADINHTHSASNKM